MRIDWGGGPSRPANERDWELYNQWFKFLNNNYSWMTYEAKDSWSKKYAEKVAQGHGKITQRLGDK